MHSYHSYFFHWLIFGSVRFCWVNFIWPVKIYISLRKKSFSEKWITLHVSVQWLFYNLLLIKRTIWQDFNKNFLDELAFSFDKKKRVINTHSYMKILKTWAHGIRIYPNWLLIRAAFTNFRNDHKMSKKRICRYKFFERF